MAGDITIVVSKRELALIKEALAIYRLRGFPLGRSSYGNPISQEERKEWRVLGMKVWDKLSSLEG